MKDNILFGNEYDREKYDATLRACELLQDIQALPNGDMTEIGEKVIYKQCNIIKTQSVDRALISAEDKNKE